MTGLKQNKGSKNCLAVVLAMATDTSVNNVMAYFGVNEHIPLTDLQMVRFLAEKGWSYGLGIEVGWNEDFMITGGEVDILEVNIKLTDYPAILIVREHKKSEEDDESELGAHAIYWDGHKLWDPDPDVEGNLDTGDYVIYSWTPIRRVENRTEKNTKSQFYL